jgi:hypothetical protein
MKISPITLIRIIGLLALLVILLILFVQYQPSNLTMLALILAAIFFSKECCCHGYGYQPKTKLDTTNPPKQQKN